MQNDHFNFHSKLVAISSAPQAMYASAYQKMHHKHNNIISYEIVQKELVYIVT